MTRPPARRAWLVPLGLMLLLGGLVLSTPVAASTLHVTNCTDTGVSGDGSLRGEIAAAAAGDTIVFNQDCTISLSQVSGTLTLTQNMTIDGTGHTVVVDGGCTGCDPGGTPSGGVGVFSVNVGVTASISGLTIRHGHNTSGGGIYNAGNLTVTNCTISDNSAFPSASDGGGIDNYRSGTLTVTNCMITGNTASRYGGGIVNYGTASVAGSTISGNSAFLGGGIYSDFNSAPPTVTVTNSTLSSNSAFDGGGIENYGTATVTNSTLSGNSASGSGGGINSNGGTVTVTSSTLSGNSTGGSGGLGGGGINSEGGAVTVTNTTLSGNSAGASGNGGGGMRVTDGTLAVTNGTLAGNSASSGYGGGIFQVGGTVALTNIIAAGNSAPNGSDLYAGASGGHNLIGDPIDAHFTDGVNGNIVGHPALLGTLGSYGGPTQTVPLLPGSLAIDAGDDTVCATTGTGNVSHMDQRGVARPVGAHCDIGAFESQGFTFTNPTGTRQSAPINTAFAAPLGITVTANKGTAPFNEPVNGGQVTFTAPPGGASATLTGSPATIVGGTASVNATANGTVGGPYTVLAVATGTTPASVAFSLTNIPVTPVVNSTDDGVANIANCLAGNARTCRLRDVIAAVNSGGATGTTITFDGTVFPAGTAKTIMLPSGTLTLSASMAIDGTGHTVLVDGGGSATVFTVNSGVTASLSNLTIQHGYGDGILNHGTLSVTNSTITNNSGGGINNTGTMTVTSSTISGNSTGYGGGILNTGTMTVTNSTLSGNAATGSGGYPGYGGGINSSGTITVTNSTISGNSAIVGGGIYIGGGTLNLTNTIVGGNTGTDDPDLSTHGGTINSGGRHNLIGGTPLLGTLGNYGGPTRTIPLLPGSPAIGAGDATVCATTAAGRDQRGVIRQASVCSIGAYEAQPATPNPLPAPKPPAPVGGPPSALPATHPAGAPGGVPNPQPVPRP